MIKRKGESQSSAARSSFTVSIHDTEFNHEYNIKPRHALKASIIVLSTTATDSTTQITKIRQKSKNAPTWQNIAIARQYAAVALCHVDPQAFCACLTEVEKGFVVIVITVT